MELIFSARLNATSSGVTGDGTNVVIPFDVLEYSKNNCYNISTNTFTVQDPGYYLFLGGILLTNVNILNTLLDWKLLNSTNSTSTAFAYQAITNVIASTTNFGTTAQTMFPAFSLIRGDSITNNLLVGGNAAKNIDIYGTTNNECTYWNCYKIK